MFDIIDFIPEGEENAISQAELAALLNCSKREVRALIFCARIEGALICSCPDAARGGYFRPRTNAEIRRFLAFCEHRINSTKQSIKGAKRFLRKGGFNDDVI